MTKNILSDQKLRQILEIARLAPSVHNSQPWLVQNNGQILKIMLDKRHKLGVGDPVNRQNILSLGIFTEALVVSAATVGLSAKEVIFKENEARLEFEETKKTADINDANLLENRSTDRSIYTKVKLDGSDKESIEKSWTGKNVKVWLRDDREFIEKIAGLTSKGIGLALSNPDFRKELSQYLLLPWSSKKRGISVRSLYLPWLIAIAQPVMMRLGINTGQEARLEEKRWLSSSAVVLITSEGDLHNDWFEAGRAYLRSGLAIEKLGLSQATSAATVEASTFHEDIEEILGTKQRLQAVIRVGKGSSKRQYSPRISGQEIIT